MKLGRRVILENESVSSGQPELARSYRIGRDMKLIIKCRETRDSQFCSEYLRYSELTGRDGTHKREASWGKDNEFTLEHGDFRV